MSSSEQTLKQLQDHLTSINSDSLESYLDDLQFLKDKLDGKKIVGMGEATHSSREFYTFRAKFFRFLVEEIDYRIFAWEASFGETLAINDYVVNGEGTRKKH